MSIEIVHDDLSLLLSRVSCGDCAIEIEHYPGVGVHLLINTPPNAVGETEELELWVHADGRFVVETHRVSGQLDEDGELLCSSDFEDLPDNVLSLPRSKK